ncbi:MAG: hypothetical protein V4509_01525 [Patescibacteria group bacterium]
MIEKINLDKLGERIPIKSDGAMTVGWKDESLKILAEKINEIIEKLNS